MLPRCMYPTFSWTLRDTGARVRAHTQTHTHTYTQTNTHAHTHAHTHILKKKKNFSQLYCPHGKFGLLSPGKASCDRVVLPNLLCILGALVFP